MTEISYHTSAWTLFEAYQQDDKMPPMRPMSISLDGFGSWANPQAIDLSNTKAIAIVGDNGAGKSSMLEAILYALFGWIRAHTINEQISSGKNALSVEFVWEQDGDKWRVLRSKAQDGANLSLFKMSKDGEWATVESGVKSTQAVIDRLIGCSAEDMIASCWIRQGDSDKFCNARPAERRQILERILNLPYAAMAKEANERSKIANAEIAALQQARATAEEAASSRADTEAELKRCSRRLSELDQEIRTLQEHADATRDAKQTQAAIDNLRAQIRTLRADADRLSRSQNDILSLQRDIAGISEQLTELQEKTEQGNSRLQDLSSSISKAQEIIAHERANADENRTRLDTLNLVDTDSTCYTCHQPIPEEVWETLVEECNRGISASEDKISKAEKRLAKLTQERSDLSHEINSSGGLTRRLETDLRNKQSELGKAQATVDSLYDTPRLLSEAESRLGALTDAQEGSDNSPSTAEAIGRLTRERDELLRQEGGFRTSLEHISRQEKLLEDTASEWTKQQEHIEALELIRRACNGDQIPSRVIESKLTELEEEINYWLDTICNGTMKVRLATRKESSSKSAKDTLLILVSTSQGTMDYSNLSGGEQLRLDLACRIGISRLLADRSGTPIRFLVIDEGWGTLDKQGIDALMGALMNLTSVFDLVVTITHVPDVARAFPARLEVSKASGYSSADLVLQNA